MIGCKNDDGNGICLKHSGKMALEYCICGPCPHYVEKNLCLDCDCYDSDFGCTMSSIDKSYACPYGIPK